VWVVPDYRYWSAIFLIEICDAADLFLKEFGRRPLLMRPPVRPEFQADMQAFLDAEHAAGLHTVLLEDWIK